MTINRLRAQYRSKRFLIRELIRSRFTTSTPLKILFSARDGWVEPLARKFSLTRHQVTFGDIQNSPLDHYDLVIPLDMKDVRFLSARRSRMRNLIPIPRLEAIDLCDDKLKFHEHLGDRGFGKWLPRTGATTAHPYVLKKRIDEAGEHCHIVTTTHQELALATQLSKKDYFQQEYIPGRYVFASHILYLGGRIVYALDVEYSYNTDYPINSKTEPALMMIRPCSWTSLFSDMLASIGYEGLCCVDYKMRDGEPVVLEINPRLGRSATGYFFAFLNHLPSR
ncbi:MAG: ATP-grasp domain-containing protein [Alphaproteobacteria bacterium]|nr:ATP-grasp domain-containing protein [Alphaproteobacteria bacterium]